VRERVRETVRAGERRYLEATVREALRLRPPVPTFGRALAAPLQVGPYTVPAGTGVGVNTWSLHRRPDLFPDPEELRPERFLDDGPPAHAYLPFGGGVRRCLGAAFAEQEVRVVVRALLARVDLELVSRRPEGSRLRGVTLVPARGVRIRIRSAPRGA
jgi:cytochrome P450